MKLLILVTAVAAGVALVAAAPWPEKNGVPCTCTRLHSPVCGSDGIDYPNPDCARNCGKVSGFRRGTCDRPALCGCPYNIAPVCARRPDGTLDQFDNACQASCNHGAEIVNEGPCAVRPVQPIYIPDDQQKEQEIEKRRSPPCVCPRIYLPVCARTESQLKTFDNDCQAGCSGAVIQSQGRCEAEPDNSLPGLEKREACICTQEYDPVCGRKNNVWRTYSNQCVANCHGAVTRRKKGGCGTEADNSLPGLEKRGNCICTRHLEPTCGLKDGVWKTYSNPCMAGCYDAEETKPGACEEAVQLPIFPGVKEILARAV